MFDSFLAFAGNILKSRILPLVFIYVAFASAIVYKVFTIQIVRQEELVQNETVQSEVMRETKATRGNIYDSNGVLLAYNKLSYDVTLQDYDAFETEKEKNAMIHRLIKIIEANEGTLFPEFYIEKDDS